VPLPVDVPVSHDVRAVPVRGRLHVFAGRPSADGVTHLVLDPAGGCRALADLPLATVSGAVTGPDGPVLAGARSSDHAPVVQAWPEPPVELRAPQGVDDPIAAWPVPVATDVVRVVWATGRESATVWLGELTHAGVVARPVLRTPTVLSLQALGLDGRVDLLCETVAGARLVRIAAGANPVESAAPRDGLLAPGYVLTSGDGEVRCHPLAGGTPHRSPLPDWPAGQHRRVRRLSLAGDLLAWTTERVDDPAEPETLGWAARFDPGAGFLGPAVALPAPGEPAAVRILDDRIVVLQPVLGQLRVWTTWPT